MVREASFICYLRNIKLLKRFIKFTILLFIFFITPSLNAQQIEEIKKCSLIDDQMERLACFDTLAKILTESPKPKDEVMPDVEKSLTKEVDISVEEGLTKSSKKIIENQKEKIVSLETRIKSITRQRDVEKKKNEAKYEPLSATIISVSFRDYKYRFELDNGETWQLIDSGKRARLKKGETVNIIPGQMRSFFLKNSKGQFRVKKIK